MREVSLASGHGQQHREHGMAGSTVKFNDAPMTGDEVLRYRKAQACATNAPSDQRIEQRVF